MSNEFVLDTPEKVQEFARIWHIKMDEDKRQIQLLLDDMPNNNQLTLQDLDINVENIQFDHDSFPDDSKDFFRELDKILTMMGMMSSNKTENTLQKTYNPLVNANGLQTSNNTPRMIRRFI